MQLCKDCFWLLKYSQTRTSSLSIFVEFETTTLDQLYLSFSLAFNKNKEEAAKKRKSTKVFGTVYDSSIFQL